MVLGAGVGVRGHPGPRGERGPGAGGAMGLGDRHGLFGGHVRACRGQPRASASRGGQGGAVAGADTAGLDRCVFPQACARGSSESQPDGPLLLDGLGQLGLQERARAAPGGGGRGCCHHSPQEDVCAR